MRSLMEKYPGMEILYVTVNDGAVVREPAAMSTVLGSCVAVTFYSPRHKLGAMFHALLPRWREYKTVYDESEKFKYVDSAVECMVRSMLAKGVNRSEIECKVFGGAGALFHGEMNVGRKNVQAALETIKELGLSIQAADVGGEQGRRILFLASTGEVFLKRLGKNGPRNKRG